MAAQEETELIQSVPSTETLAGALPDAKEKDSKKFARSLTSLISGSFLTTDSTLSNLPYLLFIAILGIFYIGIENYTENREKEKEGLSGQVKELRSQYRVVADNLMYLSKEKEVAAASASLGIKELFMPPQKIIIKNNKGGINGI